MRSSVPCERPGFALLVRIGPVRLARMVRHDARAGQAFFVFHADDPLPAGVAWRATGTGVRQRHAAAAGGQRRAVPGSTTGAAATPVWAGERPRLPPG